MAQQAVVVNPNIELTLEQLLSAIRRLDEPTRQQVARALLETQMDEKLGRLIEQLTQTPPADEIDDAEIMAEIRTVRRRDESAYC